MCTAAAGEDQIARGNQDQCRLAAVTDRNSSWQHQGDASSMLHGGETKHATDTSSSRWCEYHSVKPFQHGNCSKQFEDAQLPMYYLAPCGGLWKLLHVGSIKLCKTLYQKINVNVTYHSL